MALVRLYQPVRPLVMVSRSSRIPLTTLAPDQLLRSSSKPPKSSYATFAGAAQKAANWLWSKDKSTRAHDQAGVGPERCAPTTSHRDVAHCRERRTLSISGGARSATGTERRRRSALRLMRLFGISALSTSYPSASLELRSSESRTPRLRLARTFRLSGGQHTPGVVCLHRAWADGPALVLDRVFTTLCA